MGSERDLFAAELGARHLQQHRSHALSDLGCGAVHDRAPVGAQHHAGGAEVVEALGEADVLVADGEADAPRDALATRGVARAAREPSRIPRRRLGLGHWQRGRLADDVGGGQRPRDALPGRQHVARGDRIAQAQLDRIHAELGREPVHLRLGAEARLHRAEAAHRAAGRVVRVHDRALDQRIGNGVRAGREGAGVGDDRCGAGGIRPAVQDDPAVHARESPIARGAVFEAHARGMAMDVADERLGAPVDDAHGPARVQGQQGTVDLHREIFAPAECAPDAGQVDAHLLGRQAEAGRDLVAIDVQPLRGDVDVDAALPVGHGEARLRAEERLILDPDLVLPHHHDLARRRGVAVLDHDRAHDVGPWVVR